MRLANHPLPLLVRVDREEQTATYAARSPHSDIAAVQTVDAAPTNAQIFYFEVKILGVSQDLPSRITVGLTSTAFLLTRQPGSEPQSFGYRSEDGKKLCGSPRGESYGPPFGLGDVVGCGIHYSRREVFFTRNGLYLEPAGEAPLVEYFPTVSLHNLGEKVQFIFDSKTFAFDINTLIQEDEQMERQVIAKEPFDWETGDAIVRAYLLHGGFPETLAAFDAAIEARRVGRTMDKAQKAGEETRGSENCENEPRDFAPRETMHSSTKDESAAGVNGEGSKIVTDTGESKCWEVTDGEMRDRSADSRGGGDRATSSREAEETGGDSSRATQSIEALPAAAGAREDSTNGNSERREGVVKEVGRRGRHREFASPSKRPFRSSRSRSPRVSRSPGPRLVEENSKVGCWNEILVTESHLRKLDESMCQRMEIREALRTGCVPRAMELVGQFDPGYLTRVPIGIGAALLITQQMIELLRDNPKNSTAAVLWMRLKMAPLFKEKMSPAVQAVLAEACCVLALGGNGSNADGKVGWNPRQQFDVSRRELTASTVNSELIDSKLSVPRWSPLHTLVRHLVACRILLREADGGVGLPVEPRSLLLANVFSPDRSRNSASRTGQQKIP